MTAAKYVLVITALLLFVLLGSFFLYNFGKANNITYAKTDCQAMCQSLLGKGFNFNSCDELRNSSDALTYIKECPSPCIVKTKERGSCIIGND